MTMDAKTKDPFPLVTVLEEEYVKLHGPLPSGTTVAEADRLAALYRHVHNLPQQRTALCLSGGGIRSATFALGVLQGLSRLSLLKRFDYLSTVSGGGYIGSWLTAWVHRHPDGVAGVMDDLRRPPSDTKDPEPEAVNWLRRYSNYLSPRLGLMSVDSWTLFGTYLRNLTLNWLVLVPMLATVLLTPRLLVSILHWEVANPRLPAQVMFAAGLLLGVVGLTHFHLFRPSLDHLRSSVVWKYFERQQWFLIGGLTPMLTAVLLLTTAFAWYRNGGGCLKDLTLFFLDSRGTFLLGGASMHGLGWLIGALLLRRWRSADLWLVIEFIVILWSGSVGGLFLWSILAETPPDVTVSQFAEWYAVFAVPGFLTMFLLTATIFIGVASRYTDDHDREWWGRAGAWMLIASIFWMGLNALVIFGPGLLSYMPALITSVGGLSGLISLLLGFSSKTTATAKGKPSMIDVLLDRAVRLAAPVFIACLLVLITLLTSLLMKGLGGPHKVFEESSLEGPAVGLRMPADVWGHAVVLHNSPPWLVVEVAAAFILLATALSLVININKFSLHSIYRNRLIRAYLGASRLSEYQQERRPNLFTGFDPNDNIQLKELAPQGQTIKKPFHVVNIAINLVRGENLAWQQRKAQSFTASPLFCGSWNLGYRRSGQYGVNARVEKGKAITLGTAMAISGAAASPNMGYHSAPAVTFLLAFFNIRLGWWLGNPGPAGRNTFDVSCPRIAVRPLLAETFGLTDAENPYVYLSDGGHFENLGLYEMVLRRCHYIVVSDGSCDTARAFTDLGNAIRKIRIDLGIDIEIETELLELQAGARMSRAHFALGLVRYDRVDAGAPAGLLIYLKPSLTGNEPADVTEYANCHEEFPHEPTADQFFDESQFESYRALGFHIAHQVFTRPITNPTGEAEQLFERFRSGQPGKDSTAG
ncbi:MAG TPA: patatin-like phospholipase family protein [Nitrospira sp.]|nr:patatin-like phospholipase family protein [Nitrospira sp.]